MQSTASVTIQCRSRIILVICSYSICTGSGGLLTVLPLTPVRSGPKIRSDFFTALSVMTQLDIMFEHTIPRNLQSVGCPNISCALWAAFASSTSRLVKPSMLFQTVLIMSWIRHRATSASTFLRLRNCEKLCRSLSEHRRRTSSMSKGCG